MEKSNTDRLCSWCKMPYQAKNSWQKTCSYKCGYSLQNNKVQRGKPNLKNCGRCGISLIGKKSNAIYCSTTCKSMDHNFKHRGTESDRVSTARRRLIIERDAFTCYLCKKLTALELIEIDHLIPRSRKGTSAPSNLSVTCRDCNRGRGNRIGIEQLFRLYELRASDDH